MGRTSLAALWMLFIDVLNGKNISLAALWTLFVDVLDGKNFSLEQLDDCDVDVVHFGQATDIHYADSRDCTRTVGCFVYLKHSNRNTRDVA